MVLADELDLDEADCYVKPEIEDDNEKLLAVIDEMNSYVGTTITYDFDVAKEVLDGERISEWLSVDDDLNLVVDEEGVLSFVKELASEYNTCYKPKELKTSYGSTVTISNGPYGWKINNSEEVAQILDDLKAGKKVNVNRFMRRLQTVMAKMIMVIPMWRLTLLHSICSFIKMVCL